MIFRFINKCSFNYSVLVQFYVENYYFKKIFTFFITRAKLDVASIQKIYKVHI